MRMAGPREALLHAIIRKNSQEELIYHAKTLELLAKKSVMVIHLNSKRELVERLGEEKYQQWVTESVMKLPPWRAKGSRRRADLTRTRLRALSSAHKKSIP